MSVSNKEKLDIAGLKCGYVSGKKGDSLDFFPGDFISILDVLLT